MAQLDELSLLLGSEARVRVQDLYRPLVSAHRERGIGGVFGGQLEGRLGELSVWSRVVDEADRHRPRRAQVASGEEQLLGTRDPDDVDELLQASVAVDQAELGGRHPEPGPDRAQPQVAADRQLEASPEAM